MDNESIRELAALLFFALLVGAALSDLHRRRIPNTLVLAILAIGITAGMLGISSTGALAGSLYGVAVGLALWFPIWMLGLLGAGDVKFFAAAAAWIGPSLAWRASVAAVLLGGLLGVVMLIRRSGFDQSAAIGYMSISQSRVIIAGADVGGAPDVSRTLPYAVPMAIALAVAVFYPKLLGAL